MDLMNIIEGRYSCRKFADDQLTDAELEAILNAGRLAPSAINRQDWRFLVSQGSEELARVDACSKCRFGAPTAILVCFDTEESAKNPAVVPDYGWVDCGIAIAHMALEAKAIGIDSCIVGAYDPDEARRQFNIPERIQPFQFIMLGHAAADAQPGPMHADRRPLEEVVIRGTF